jgi:hypothetical protein
MTIIRGRVINSRELVNTVTKIGDWDKNIIERQEAGETVYYSRKTGKRLQKIDIKEWLKTSRDQEDALIAAAKDKP